MFGVRVAVAAVLLVAGALKAWEPAAFYLDILNYRILPELPSALLAVYLPWFEIATGVCLFIPALRRGAALCASMMFVGFIAAVGAAWIRGLDVECGCFGNALRHGNLALTLAIDATLLAFSLWLLFSRETKRMPGLSAIESS
jgi:uncharacterized membrane protein YphA (DoxX/SURF4 family)